MGGLPWERRAHRRRARTKGYNILHLAEQRVLPAGMAACRHHHIGSHSEDPDTSADGLLSSLLRPEAPYVAQEVALTATDDGSGRGEGCEVHAAFGAAFRLGGEPLIRAVLAPPLVRTVAALMAESPAGDEAKRATRAAAEPEVESPPERG